VPRISAPTIAEHRARTYDALLDAVDALIAEHGFESVSMGGIAKRAGIARTAIYNYAPDKLTLLAAAASRGAADMRASIDGALHVPGLDPPARLTVIVRLLLLTLTTSTELLLAARGARGGLDRAQTEQARMPFRTEVGARISEIVSEGIADGSFAPSDDMNLTVGLVTGAFEEALDRVIADPASGETIATRTAVFIVRALGGVTAASH
jgi:AcrR family transcriptional regulator